MQNPSFYDLFAAGTETLYTRQQFFLKEVGDAKNVLEIGAGTGNLALYLADHGRKVTCLEPSPTVLINLSAKVFNSDNYRKNVTIIPHKRKKVNFSKMKFDCVIISYVMPYIYTDKQRRTMLGIVRKKIVKGGTLLVTFFTTRMARSEKKHFDEERKVGDSIVKRFAEYKRLPVHKEYSLVNVIWYFEVYRYGRLSENFREEFICRCENTDYVDSLLSGNGWKINSKFADYTYSPHSDNVNSDIIVVIAEKK